MANLNIKKGLLTNLDSVVKKEGQILITTDERAAYVDVSDSVRIRLGDFQEFETLNDLKANTNPSTTALYYISDVNVLAKYNGTDYVQINTDTGATDIELVGEGDIITSVSYDATTRKLTLTKGTSLADVAYGEDSTLGDTISGIQEDVQEISNLIGVIPSVRNEESGEDVPVASSVIDYVDQKTGEGVSALNGTAEVSDVEGESGDFNVLTGVRETEGVISKKSEKTLKKVASTGAAADVSVADEAGNLDATTVEDAIAELYGEIQSKGESIDVTMEESTGTGDIAKVYKFYKGVKDGDSEEVKASKLFGSINIPKDMVAIEGKLVVASEENKVTDSATGTETSEGTFIEITIANGDPFYINVTSLIEYVTGGDTTEISVSVDEDTHVVTATVKKISATKIIYKEAVEADADNGIEAQAEETVAQALNRLENAASNAISGISADVDAELDDSVEQDDEAVAVVSGVVQSNGEITSVDSTAVDKAGAATRAYEKALGTDTDASGADTIKGVNKAVGDLKDLVGNLPEDTESETVVDYIDEKVSSAITWGTF